VHVVAPADSTIEILGQPLRRFVGDNTAKVFASKLEVHTVDDLLRHYPRRYAERGELTDLSELRPDEDVTVLAEIAAVKKRRMQHRKGSILEVVVTDGRGRLTLTFFNQNWRERDLVVGRRGLFAGKVSSYRNTWQLAHPDYELLGDAGEGDPDPDAFAGALIPVYPASANLRSWKIAKAVKVVLDVLGAVPDPVPTDVRDKRDLIGLTEALHKIHRPQTQDDVRRARDRLRYDEAFLLQTLLAQRRLAARDLPATPRVAATEGLLTRFAATLPFRLTQGQREIGDVIAHDLAHDHPMHRLLQGEVGSGKTLVALEAMLTVVDAGGQAALLAPTEVLAQQHHRSICELLGPLAQRGRLGGDDHGTSVALLTGSQGTAARRQTLLDVASGDAGIVIGTHALLQEHVEFFDLGLVVVDEQHRFGVEQRDALRAKGKNPPHLLVMTATPIPRTVALTVFGDLEVSTLTELPAGRSPISTYVVPVTERPHYLERSWERVREEVASGRQVYVVAPRIGDAEGTEDDDDVDQPVDGDLDASTPRRPAVAVLDLAPSLIDGPLTDLRVEILHGRLPSDVKDGVMRRFEAGLIDVLVATTVIEVGVDVANATVMVVMDADRFGVSQLHQLRGRVGRGAWPGLCLLVTEVEEGTPARERLDAVAATTDGFVLSRLDLEQRREGDVLGTSQAGHRSRLRLLRAIRDEEVIGLARDDATEVVADDPALSEHPALAAAVEQVVAAQNADYLEKA
jgi:ATP-dependent DNA helicase RecG